MAESKTVVHVVDDDAGMRKSLSVLIESASIKARVYDSGEQFLSESRAKPPDCAVLVLRIPGINGLEILQRLRATRNDIPVVLISAHADVPMAVRGMKLGAVDLLQKPVEPAVLLKAIKRSMELSRNLAIARHDAMLVRQRFEHLTAREMELLNLIVDGHANKQIARSLNISIKTVANHRANLMTKTAASNAADLARLFTVYKSLKSPGDNGSLAKNPAV